MLQQGCRRKWKALKDKEGKEKRNLGAPAENDWTLLKKKTESDLVKSGKLLVLNIYDTLLSSPGSKN